MDEIQKSRQRSLLFKLGNSYLIRRTSGIRRSDTMGYSLTETQRMRIRKLRWKVYLIGGGIGALAVILVIFPFHFTTLLNAQTFHVFGYEFQFELSYTIYGILMLLPEIWLLNLLNIYAVKELCEIYQYPSVNQKDYQEQVALLTEAGLEMPSKHMKLLEVDPFIGLTKFSYYALFLLNKLKAALSNVLMKLLIRRLLGRYAIRIVTDLAGIPIYAFWNAWSCHQVMKEAQMRIVATAATQDFLNGFSDADLQGIKSKLPLLVHFIAQQKRQYNFALFAFIKSLVDRVPDLDLKYDEEVKLENILTGDLEQNKLIGRLLVFGFIVDGSLSVKERLTLHKLDKEDWFPMSISDVELLLKSYVGGLGMKRF